jgi:molybdenum-dependent DNA-binding transcriptional regulator ModE
MPWDERIGRLVKLRDLYVLKAVTELGSMGKAAAKLAMPQPAISQSISDLEHVLGVRLLDRSRYGVEATAYGSAFLKWSTVIFDNLTQGVEEIDYLIESDSRRSADRNNRADDRGARPARCCASFSAIPGNRVRSKSGRSAGDAASRSSRAQRRLHFRPYEDTEHRGEF